MGVWNEAGDVLDFSIAAGVLPDELVSGLVRGLCSALLWAAYQLRMRQVQRGSSTSTLEARVGERTRIARELHDTLLQSFHGLLLRFQTASYLLPERPAEAKDKLDIAIEHAAKAITEGRDAVQGLRASTVERNDLAVAIRTLGDELATDASVRPAARHSVSQSRARRAICTRSFVTRSTRLRRKPFGMPSGTRMPGGSRSRSATTTSNSALRVRDDGKGIDPKVLANQGLEGHYGLRGMPERAALIGGKLAVWSEVGAGTEVELRLPASIVYATSRRRSWWSRLLASKTAAHVGGDAS